MDAPIYRVVDGVDALEGARDEPILAGHGRAVHQLLPCPAMLVRCIDTANRNARLGVAR